MAKAYKHNRIAVRRGFTIVEVATVLFIVAIGLIGILSLIVKNVQSQGYNKQNLVAYQLAQEGIELIREVRDTNWNNGEDFRTGIASDGSYYMDYLDTAPLTASGPQALYLDSDGFYSHDSAGTDSGFRRLITITTDSPDSFLVSVTVDWPNRENGERFSYVLETILYDWR